MKHLVLVASFSAIPSVVGQMSFPDGKKDLVWKIAVEHAPCLPLFIIFRIFAVLLAKY